MQGRASDAKGKGKAAEALKRPRRNTPRFNQGTIAVPNAFLKTGPSKRARIPRLPSLLTIVEPFTIVHETNKTSSSGSIRVKQYLAGDDRSHHFQDPHEITNTYALGGLRVAIGGSSSESTFTPEDAVDFMCANARNFIQSTKGVGPGKMFNDDRMRVATFYTWMVYTF
ncbi:hypothetical protein ACOSP7_017082 [Xanthoceras sorbifolium]